MFKSNRNPQFRSKFSEDIFNTKYSHEGAETFHELSCTLVNDVCASYPEVDTSIMLAVTRSSLITATFLKQRKIIERIGPSLVGRPSLV